MRMMPKLSAPTLAGLAEWVQRFIALSEQEVPESEVSPVGTRAFYYGTGVPDGWLVIDSSFVSRDFYPELYNVLGLTFSGSPPAGTFRLPPAPAAESGGQWLIRARN